MRRAIPMLRGLAILGVVFNHANWHVLSQISAGEPQGHLFLVFDQIGKFAIPAFLVIAGYFIAYATGGGSRDLPWKVIWARLVGLLWPWVIWSVVFVIGQSFRGRAPSLEGLARTLFIHYYFVPMLAVYYLLSPLVVKCVQRSLSVLLFGAAATQILAVGLFYARLHRPEFPRFLVPWVDVGPLMYARFAFYLPLGIVCGTHARQIKAALVRIKPILPWLVLLSFGLSVVETAAAYNLGGALWPKGGDHTKLSSALFSLALILWCMASYGPTIPLGATIGKVGRHSYGVYLCHYLVLGTIAQIAERFVPAVAAAGWLYMPLLFFTTLLSLLLFMEGVVRLPTRRLYQVLFG